MAGGESAMSVAGAGRVPGEKSSSDVEEDVGDELDEEGLSWANVNMDFLSNLKAVKESWSG